MTESKAIMNDFMQLNDVVLIGRTMDEYLRIFALTDSAKTEHILDAASGICSFTAEANALGWNVTASDRVYQFDADMIEQKCRQDLVEVIEKLEPIQARYVWDFFPDIPSLQRQREKAYTRFLRDYRQYGQDRYHSVVYPKSPFANNQFTLTLVSHFLFLYEDQLDYDFHKATLLELLRITSKEIRIFPIVNLRNQRCIHLTQMMADPDFKDLAFTIEPVDYEFLRNANEVLIIHHK